MVRFKLTSNVKEVGNIPYAVSLKVIQFYLTLMADEGIEGQQINQQKSILMLIVQAQKYLSSSLL